MTTATLSRQDLMAQVKELVAPFGEATERHFELLLEETLMNTHDDAMFFLRLPYSLDRVTCEYAEAWHHTIEGFNMSTRACGIWSASVMGPRPAMLDWPTRRKR